MATGENPPFRSLVLPIPGHQAKSTLCAFVWKQLGGEKLFVWYYRKLRWRACGDAWRWSALAGQAPDWSLNRRGETGLIHPVDLRTPIEKQHLKVDRAAFGFRFSAPGAPDRPNR
jgi:hypothetical protein